MQFESKLKDKILYPLTSISASRSHSNSTSSNFNDDITLLKDSSDSLSSVGITRNVTDMASAYSLRHHHSGSRSGISASHSGSGVLKAAGMQYNQGLNPMNEGEDMTYVSTKHFSFAFFIRNNVRMLDEVHVK